MSLIEYVTYGPGGFDRSKPDNNVIKRDTVEVPAPASTEGRIAALEAEVKGMKDAARAEAAKAAPTAKGVAQAIAQGPA